jgi:23S rRNA (adenine2503-C2)-methyltransferase
MGKAHSHLGIARKDEMSKDEMTGNDTKREGHKVIFMDKFKPEILDLTIDQLKELVVSLGGRPYRGGQILQWIYKKSAASFAEMTDLPSDLREKLATETSLFTLTSLEEKIAAGGQTRKLLFQLGDKKTIESTLMFYENSRSHRERRTVCISTQVGCPVGCYFCATGQQGFERNLRPGEIIEQVLYFIRFIKKEIPTEDHELSRKAITNVVLMGMGEPLANYDNVRQAVMMLNSKDGLELGARQITLSTAGLVPQIKRLAAEPLHLELAISLHAANNNLRDRLMPINKKYPLGQLIPACREYLEKTGRRPTFEYALFQGVNDSAADARELAGLLNGLNCSVNIIVGNPTSCQEFRSSTLAQAIEFQKALFSGGIFNTIRVSRGTDIEAGCGQLKSRYFNS